MVSPDAKHDYYADLELPATADIETIKKQFRLLAKQYHPDRNPGKEVDVVPKFQAVQAAHEILCDPQLKSKYDLNRAKYLKKTTEPEPGFFKRAHTTKTPTAAPAHTQSARPRNASVDERAQFANGRAHTSASAEKFAAFNRAGSQQWDRAKFEHAGEALRNFQSMRGQGAPPSRPPRAPTAPKSSSTGPSADYVRAPNASPGFPGLSRTHSAPRRPGAFSPAYPGADEPPAQSAYNYVHSSRDKPLPGGYQYAAPPPVATSPPTQRARPSGSPLRQSKSSGFDDVERPAFGRIPSQYATSSGERTNLNGPGIARSASVRTSPVDKQWDNHGPFGARAQSQASSKKPPARHRSASPKVKPHTNARFDFSVSESTSSGSEREMPPPNPTRRIPRKQRQTPNGRSSATNETAFEGQHPATNYTRTVDDSQYQYPPPKSRDTSFRKPFEDTTSPIDNITEGLHNTRFKSGPDTNNYKAQDADDRPYLHHSHAKFSAAEWDNKFSSSENIFAPTDRDRRSPTKNSRSRPPPTSKTRAAATDLSSSSDSDSISPTMPDAKHTRSMDSFAKSAAFAQGRSDDWAEKLKARASDAPSAASARQTAFQPDAMDIDTNGEVPAGTAPKIHVEPASTTQEHFSTTPNVAFPTPRSQRGSVGGVDLADLGQAPPFIPEGEGLDSMSADLGNSLPFHSRAAGRAQITTPSGVALKNLNLPQPPRPVVAPAADCLTQAAWMDYASNVKLYMHRWNDFNSAMISHFVDRQEQIDHTMYRNWVTSMGDGVHAEEVDGFEIKSHSGSSVGEDNNGNGGPKLKLIAGYATYMEWLEQDILCRRYWDYAVQEHRLCLQNLGRIRDQIRKLVV